MSRSRTTRGEETAPPREPLYPVYPHWLWGGGCLQFQASFRFGQGGVHQLKVDVRLDEIARDAAALRADPSATHHDYTDVIRRGRSQQVVPIPVPRAMLLGIADALAGAQDVDDAGHRFYHWQNPDTPRPCSTCRETLDGQDQRADAARTQFLTRWAIHLHISTRTVEQLLREFSELPRKALR